MIVIETERLLLSCFTQADVDSLARLYADPETMRFFGGPRDRVGAELELEWCLHQYERNRTTGACGPAFWATTLKSNGHFVGRCGLLPQIVDERAEAEVAYMIAHPYWNQGLATEAAHGIKAWGFQHYKFPRLISTIIPANRASIRVAQKIRMHYEKEVQLEGHIHHLYSVERPLEMVQGS